MEVYSQPQSSIHLNLQFHNRAVLILSIHSRIGWEPVSTGGNQRARSRLSDLKRGLSRQFVPAGHALIELFRSPYVFGSWPINR
jgi:hypothetical protein